ncbi:MULTISPECIES: hypothetical protein [Kamptonema]|uniref:hypothetical protein n=1 Tax=Kamptonema TaxID=1501433 RepID=UPI0001DAC31A|nr:MULTISPECIES: hypothetical protein [Kamptonema]CBN58463.1 conserved membrane hypothetical protein [Kamptonema sp. PCC 6506]
MLLTLETIGNWNPQLFRELKGRFNFRNVTIAASISILCQSLLVAIISAPSYTDTDSWEINSQEWFNIFQSLNWILPIILVLGGAYMLIGDMAKEERRGTLNFIRLTPQPSQSVLIGKILGVPVLLYFAIALALPLHLWTATSAGVAFGFVLTIYLMVGAICSFFYSGVLLSTLLGASQPWAGAILSLLLAYPLLLLLNFFIAVLTENRDVLGDINLPLNWYYLPVGSNLGIACLFYLLSICLGTCWIWQLLNRRFRNPNATTISKSQSYLLVTCVNLWMLGFGVIQTDSYLIEGIKYIFLFFLFFLLPCYFLILIAALLPHRQALQDWARYRGERKNEKKGIKTIFSAFPVAVQDLILGEKSPALVAIAINIAITAAIWIPWMLLLPEQNNSLFNTWEQYSKNQVILTFFLTANLILICAAIAQLTLLMKTRKPEIWAATAVSAVIILPLVTMAALGFTFEKNPDWFLISPLAAIAIQKASTTAIFLTILGQWSVLALLSLQLTRQLRKIGESNSKSLLAVRPSLPASSN